MSHFCADPTTLQFEISSMCNALCLGCIRTDRSTFNNLRSTIPDNKIVTLQTYKDILTSPSFYTVSNLEFCGTIDDPIIHPNFIEMLEFTHKVNPKMSISIHTNGSLRSTEWWKELAKVLKQFPYDHRIFFALDGLSDTHSIYRQRTDFDKIIKNAKTFIEAGGTAVWMYTVFPWNEHQIEDARNMSKQLGFTRFDHRKDRTGMAELGLETIQKRKAKNKKSLETTNMTVDHLINGFNDRFTYEISCNNKNKNKYYISWDSRLWPCCFIPNGFLHKNRARTDFLQKRIFDVYGEDFNLLTKHSVDEILENDFFMSNLVESWNNPVGLGPCGKITRCAETCSVPILDKRPIGEAKKEWL